MCRSQSAYVFIPSCSVAFSFGSLIYHFRDRLPMIVKPWPAVVAAALWWGHVGLSWTYPGGPWTYGLYTSLIFSAVAMVALMRLDPGQMPAWLRKLDRLAGNLSYPVYLCHWGVAIVVTAMIPSFTRASIVVFLICFLLVNVVSYMIYTYVEEPLQSWKLPSRLRSPARAPGIAHPAHAPGGLAMVVGPSRAASNGRFTTHESTANHAN